MSSNARPSVRARMLSSLALLLAACSSGSPPYSPPPVVVKPAAIPALPVQARQPKTPPMCSQTCSEGVSQLLDSWLPTQTKPEAQGNPASDPMTP